MMDYREHNDPGRFVKDEDGDVFTDETDEIEDEEDFWDEDDCYEEDELEEIHEKIKEEEIE